MRRIGIEIDCYDMLIRGLGQGRNGFNRHGYRDRSFITNRFGRPIGDRVDLASRLRSENLGGAGMRRQVGRCVGCRVLALNEIGLDSLISGKSVDFLRRRLGFGPDIRPCMRRNGIEIDCYDMLTAVSAKAATGSTGSDIGIAVSSRTGSANQSATGSTWRPATGAKISAGPACGAKSADASGAALAMDELGLNFLMLIRGPGQDRNGFNRLDWRDRSIITNRFGRPVGDKVSLALRRRSASPGGARVALEVGGRSQIVRRRFG